MAHRWTSERSLVTYASLEPGTAVTEILTYARDVDQLANRYLVGGEYTGSVMELEDLPKGWNAWPHNPKVQATGDAWYRSRTAGALIVPSAILPAKNVILNRDHPDFEVQTLTRIGLDALNRGL